MGRLIGQGFRQEGTYMLRRGVVAGWSSLAAALARQEAQGRLPVALRGALRTAALAALSSGAERGIRHGLVALAEWTARPGAGRRAVPWLGQALRSAAAAELALACVPHALDGVRLLRGRIDRRTFWRGRAMRTGSLLGGIGGAALGAALGSVVCPGIGTAVGSFVGSLAGAAAGQRGGRALAGAPAGAR